ncbi:MAG: glycosyltransferase family 4 protein [Planctomycetota bacterium]
MSAAGRATRGVGGAGLVVRLLMPLAWPQAGGAAEYARVLAEGLAERDEVAEVELLTQRVAGGAGEGRIGAREGLVVRRELPVVFGGGGLPRARRAVNYIEHNRRVAGALTAWSRAARGDGRSTVVLVHSGYSRRRTVVGAWVRRLKRQGCPVRYVLDVRDPLNSDASLRGYGHFDGAIGCSRAIARRLREVWPAERVAELAVPVRFERVSDAAVEAELGRRGLTRGGYVLLPGGVVAGKGFGVAFEAWRRLVERGSGLGLVSIGRRQAVGAELAGAVDEAERGGGFVHVGEVDNAAARALMAGSAAVVLASGVEGLPRAALEAMSVGAAGLWPGVEEFVEAMPGQIAETADAGRLAEQIERVAERALRGVGGASGGYDWRRHDAALVMGRYVAWLSELAGTKRGAERASG